MRDIKFRAWTDSGMQYDWLKTVIRPMSEVGGVSLPETVGVSMSTSTAYHVMQYTGLTDKNGVEIYEGDIIEFTQALFNTLPDNYPTKRDVVSWDKCKAAFDIDTTAAGRDNIKVIGNIYQNPELLNA